MAEENQTCLCGCGKRTRFFRGMYRKYAHGHNKSTLGKKFGSHTQEHKDKVSLKLKGVEKPIGFGLVGEKNPIWKGDKVGYRALHRWVEAWKGKANHCEKCGDWSKRRYSWANKDHKYRRVLDDFISLCMSCHKKYDIELKNGKKIN